MTQDTEPIEPNVAHRLELWPLDKLTPDPQNAKLHGAAQIQKIADSIQRFGFCAPILVDKAGKIVAGHGRLEAAKLLEMPEVPVIPLEHLTETERRALLLADNRLGELGGWDEERLVEELAALSSEGFDTGDLGWSDEEFEEMAEALEVGPTEETKAEPEEKEDIDQVLELPELSASRAGDVWILGDHRLGCGDSLEGDLLEQVTEGKPVGAVVTDPPYAIFGSSTGVASDVADSAMVEPLFRASLRRACGSLIPQGHAYVFCEWRSLNAWLNCAKATNLALRNILVWDKGNFGHGANYMNQHELVLFFANVPPQKRAYIKTGEKARPIYRPNILRFPRTRQNEWEKENEGGEKFHHAAKPVAMLRELIENSSDEGDEGDVVLDLFGGSGSTMMACEVAGRAARLVEKEPARCDVQIRRWQAYTGKRAVLEQTGQDYDQVLEARAAEGGDHKSATSGGKRKAKRTAKRKTKAKRKTSAAE